jgi:phosphate transport system permease protein
MTVLAFTCALIAVIPLISVIGYLLAKGLPRLLGNPAIFTQLPPPPVTDVNSPEFLAGGFGNAVLGTLMTVGIASLIAIPFGILAAIYLSEFAKDTKTTLDEDLIQFFNNVLSGVPSIVMGVFAYAIIVYRMKIGYSALAAGVALAVLMLPTIVRTATDALQGVPKEYRQAAIGLGATKFQTVSQIVLPAAIPTIVTGIILAVARAAGETAPVIFTALFSNFWNPYIVKPIATLSVLVYNFAVTPYQNWQDIAWAAALVLVMLVLIANILARMISGRR